MCSYPIVMLTSVVDVVVSDNDTMLIFEVVRGGTTIDKLQAFPVLGVHVKA